MFTSLMDLCAVELSRKERRRLRDEPEHVCEAVRRGKFWRRVTIVAVALGIVAYFMGIPVKYAFLPAGIFLVTWLLQRYC